MKTPADYEHIRPYEDDEIKDVIDNIILSPQSDIIPRIKEFAFPDLTDTEISQLFKNSSESTDQFQNQVCMPIIERILRSSSHGISTSGTENLDNDKVYVFISNHRDIIMDATLINYTLANADYPFMECAIGDNLVQNEHVRVLTRINRNFIVSRDANSIKELFQNSKMLSKYIQYAINEKKRSVWISQREGRTKDGNDRTQTSVLKMIGLGSPHDDIIKFYNSLNIMPVSISYEADPTDYLKVPHIIAKESGEEYQKEENEDLTNIISGIRGQKKRIHISYGTPIKIGDTLKQINESDGHNAFIKGLAQMIDQQIYQNYRLWPTNYIAYDMMVGGTQFTDKYSQKQKEEFAHYLDPRIASVQGFEPNLVRSILLRMYGTPVKNALGATSHVSS